MIRIILNHSKKFFRNTHTIRSFIRNIFLPKETKIELRFSETIGLTAARWHNRGSEILLNITLLGSLRLYLYIL